MLSRAARWAWRDLRGGWRHFRLVLLCLLVTLAAITAVQVTGASVLGSIRANAKLILGGDWVVRQLYQPVDAAERAWLTARGAALSDTVEMRVMLINPSTSDSALVELKAADAAYPLYGAVALDPAVPAFPDAVQRGLVLDPALGERLNVKLGDTVQLGAATGIVAAWLRDEPDRAGGGRFGLAPRVLVNRAFLTAAQLEQPGSLAYYDVRVRWPVTADIEKLERDFQTAFPAATWRLTDTARAAPQIQRYVNNLVQFLTLIGLSALLIGGIGIANGLRAYLQTRLGAIAIFKAVGMQQSEVRAIYLWQILWVGLIGIGGGLSLGALLPLWGAPLVQSFLPFPVTITVTPSGLLVPLLFGLLTTAIFALWPLGEAEQASPLMLFRGLAHFMPGLPRGDIVAAIIALAAALSAAVLLTANDQRFARYFIIGALGCFILFYGVGVLLACLARHRAPRCGLVWRTALQNLGGRGNATAQTLVSLGIGLTVLVAIAAIDFNLRATLRDNLPKDAPSFFFLDIQPDQKDGFARLVSQFPTARHLVLTPNLRGRLVSINGVPAAQALRDPRQSWLLSNERGFTYTADLPAHSTILEGSWWPRDYRGPPLLSVVDDVQRGFGVKPGDKVKVMILGREIEAAIANVRAVRWTNFTVNFSFTFAPGTLEGAPHSWLASIVADPGQEAALQRAVTRAYPNISMVRLSEAIKTVSDLLGQLGQAIRIMALLALLTGIIVLTETLLATRLRRTYDTVILKVVGASQRLLRAMLLIELGILGLSAAALAAALGTFISWAVLELWMNLPWRFYPGLALQSLVLGCGVILLTGFLSLQGLLRTRAINHLRNE